MRDGPWKLIYVQDYGYALYNLDQDLSESKNLIKSEKKRSRKMITQLNEWKAGLEKPVGVRRKSGSARTAKTRVRIIEGEYKDYSTHLNSAKITFVRSNRLGKIPILSATDQSLSPAP